MSLPNESVASGCLRHSLEHSTQATQVPDTWLLLGKFCSLFWDLHPQAGLAYRQT